MRLAILGAMMMLGACTSANGEGGGTRSVGQRDFPVGPFQAVALEGSQDVVVTVGGAPSVRAEGDSEVLERLDIRVEGDTLHVSQRRGVWLSGRHGPVTVYVTTPALTKASLEGSGDLRVDRVQGESFEASIAGSGDIDIGALQTRHANFSIAGSGGIRAAGTTDETEVDIAGSGNVRIDTLASRRARVSVAGSGNITLQASEMVEGAIMGSGDLTVRGGARCAVTKMGSGDIRCDT